MIEYRSHAMRHAQETSLSFDSRVDSFNSDRGSELRPDHKDQNNKGSVHKEARETPGSTRAATRPTVVICDSVVHLSTSGPQECDSQLFFFFFVFFSFSLFFV